MRMDTTQLHTPHYTYLFLIFMCTGALHRICFNCHRLIYNRLYITTLWRAVANM